MSVLGALNIRGAGRPNRSNNMVRNEYNGIMLGPLLDQDAEFLKAIIKMTTPKVLIEFGHFLGHSAKAMLSVMEPDAVLHSFDNTRGHGVTDPRFHFRSESQDAAHDIKDIDFIFLDASHYLDLNQKTFLNFKDRLNDKAIIAIHDTGAWVGGNVFDVAQGHMNAKGEWVHRPEEIDFVNWIRKEYPEFDQIHFHSSHQVRHGITLLQKRVTLSTE